MDTETTATTDDVAQTLGDSAREPAPWRRYIKWAVLALVVLGALYFFFGRTPASATKYVTAEVTRGSITVTVTATGNLEPRNQVDIGSELSGTMRAVNVDVNDVVTKGQVLAVLDTTRLRAQVLQAQSSLASAEARVLQSIAGAKESQANYQRLLKVRELSGNRLPSQQDLDVGEAAVARAEGETAAAKASVAQSRASLEAVKTDLSKTEIVSPINGVVLVRSVEPGQTVAASKEARANYQRLLKVRELSNNKLPSQQDLDVAEAAVAQADGEHAAAKASVSQARASLATVRTDLSKAAIRSPIDGVVLVRSVEPGQTVAASLQAPVLFTLAEDLKKMELHVAVDEADVGTVEVGQQATFTVDAFPSRTFAAKITQVHFASSDTKSTSSTSSTASSSSSTGVVTYETVLEVDNSELLLRPGMTATAQIVTTKIDDALLVPNAALRYTPESVSAAAKQPAADQRGALSSAIMPQMPRRPGANQRESRRFGRVWILNGGDPVPVMLKPGATDGRSTQVLDIDPASRPQRGTGQARDATSQQAFERKLEPGMAVIVDEATAQ